ncbi:hypothetical protein Q1695_012072 [Nippostrongylus brasiliensis]|nr:hypothetical protein Q1695_012072 [Nippostrongylus brasiliensis]
MGHTDDTHMVISDDESSSPSRVKSIFKVVKEIKHAAEAEVQLNQTQTENTRTGACCEPKWRPSVETS